MKMKSKFILRILASTVSVVLLASALPFQSSELTTADAAQTTTISNPIIWADVPDEDIIRVDDTYYMVSTTMYFSPGAPIMKSKDLVSWEICNYVYDTYADGDKQTLKMVKMIIRMDSGRQVLDTMTVTSMYFLEVMALENPIYTRLRTLKTERGHAAR